MRTALLCTCLLAGVANASSEHKAFTEHHAHEHGVASLEIGVEGKQLLIHLDSPAINVLGFEYAPRTAAEIKQVEQAKVALARCCMRYSTSAMPPTTFLTAPMKSWRSTAKSPGPFRCHWATRIAVCASWAPIRISSATIVMHAMSACASAAAVQ